MNREPSAQSWAARQRELRRAWLRGTAIAAAGVLVGGLLAGGFVAARYEAQMGQVRREAFAFRERLRTEEAARRERTSAGQRIVDMLSEPATRVIPLRGAGGNAAWNEGAGGQIVVSGLPPAPAGQSYAVWAVRAGKSSIAAILAVDATGRGSQPLASTGTPVEGFLVTLEPTSVGPAPTGPAVLTSR
jgi:hypothetical protein